MAVVAHGVNDVGLSANDLAPELVRGGHWRQRVECTVDHPCRRAVVVFSMRERSPSATPAIH